MNYPIFKGLQAPMEFMGIRGRFLLYIAIAIGIGFLGYLLFAFLVGQSVALIFLALAAISAYLYSFFAQKKGLHSKHIDKDIFVIQKLYK